jgi:hypothetical protein
LWLVNPVAVSIKVQRAGIWFVLPGRFCCYALKDYYFVAVVLVPILTRLVCANLVGFHAMSGQCYALALRLGMLRAGLFAADVGNRGRLAAQSRA